jgi:hypothetical protein
MRGIVMAKMVVLTLLGLYLAIGLSQPTGQGGSANRIAVAAGHRRASIEPISSSGGGGLSATCILVRRCPSTLIQVALRTWVLSCKHAAATRQAGCEAQRSAQSCLFAMSTFCWGQAALRDCERSDFRACS